MLIKCPSVATRVQERQARLSQANKLTVENIRPFRVLVVEDDPVDLRRSQRWFAKQPDFTLAHADTLSDSLALIEKESFDIVLLDLSLPDSKGLTTLKQITNEFDIPVVVLSGAQEKGIALKAVQSGAQDYLLKDNLDSAQLFQTLRYAIERSRRMGVLFETRESARRNTELQRLQDDSVYADSPENIASARSAPSGSNLNSDYPEVFDLAKKLYSDLLAAAMGRRVLPTLSVDISKQLNRLGVILGKHEATPRDAIQLHSVSVQQTLKQIAPDKNAVCHAEARYLLSGLLGHLCYYYRAKSQTSSPRKLTDVNS